MAKKSSLQSALNYLEAKGFEKSFNWSKTTTMAYFYDLEDENNNDKEFHKIKKPQPVRELTPEEQKALQFQRKLNIFRWVFLAAVIVFIVVGVWLTANNFFLY